MLKGPFNVSFDLQKGTGETPSFNVFEGEIPLPKIDDPVKEHYEFIGYGLEKVTKQEDFIKKYFQVTEKDVVIYAQWNQVDFKVTYDANGGLGGPVTDWVVKDPETKKGTLKFAEDPGFTKLHFGFDGWLVDEVVFKPGDTLEISEDTVVKVNWKQTDTLIHFISEFEMEWEEFTMYCQPYGSCPAPAFPEGWSFDETKWSFLGWKNEAGGEYSVGSNISPGGKLDMTIKLFLGKLRYFRRQTTDPIIKPAYIFETSAGYILNTGMVEMQPGEINPSKYESIEGFVPAYFSSRQIKQWSVDNITLVDDGRLPLQIFSSVLVTGEKNVYTIAPQATGKPVHETGSWGQWLLEAPTPMMTTRSGHLKKGSYMGMSFRSESGKWRLQNVYLDSGTKRTPMGCLVSTKTKCLWWDYKVSTPLWAFEEIT